jgi:DNA-binding PadR family transcriptional regulator
MSKTKAEIILHPVRMKILQCFIGGKKRNVQELLEANPDIAQATMYRHLKTLVKAEILEVVEENKIRGTTEKIYALSQAGAKKTNEELKQSPKEDHMRFFFMFMTQLLGDFENYLSQENIDLEKDGVGFRQAVFHLSDQEFMELFRNIGELFMKAAQNEPSSDRKKRKISTIIMPEVDKGEESK